MILLKCDYVTASANDIVFCFSCLSADGILLSKPDDITSIQLGDFAYAVTRSQIESDPDIGEMLCMALPAGTLAPEVSNA